MPGRHDRGHRTHFCSSERVPCRASYACCGPENTGGVPVFGGVSAESKWVWYPGISGMLPRSTGHPGETVSAEVMMHCWSSARVRQKRQPCPSKFLRDFYRQAHRDLVIVIPAPRTQEDRRIAWKIITRQFVDWWMGRSAMNTVGLEACVASDPEARECVESPVSTHTGRLSHSQRSPPDSFAGG